MKNHSRPTIRARPAIPPTTPPAIAPALLLVLLELPDVALLLGEEVPEGLDEEFVDVAMGRVNRCVVASVYMLT
jgi:hypothetical protein